MSGQCPVTPGEEFFSLRNGKSVTAREVRQIEHIWAVRVETARGAMMWLACSKDGIKGYRRRAP